eukprot:6735701-Prymnesium_polylepis.1
MPPAPRCSRHLARTRTRRRSRSAVTTPQPGCRSRAAKNSAGTFRLSGGSRANTPGIHLR